jgi:acetyl esterase
MSAAAVDPGLQTLLDQLAAMGSAGVESVSPPEAREQYKLLFAMDGGPEEVGSVADGEIAGVPVRTYTPKDGEPVGTLAWFHGGGWVIGDRDTADTTARKLANRAGCTVVSVDYRLAPEHPFPAAIDDCWAVVQALAADAATGPLAVGGDSAGGNLAAVCAIKARDAGIRLAEQLLVYPVTDCSTESASYVENGEGKLLTAATMRWFRGHYVGDEHGADPDASPLLAADLAGVAPAHVVTAGHDPLRDEGDAYAERLAAAGVTVDHDRYPTMIHGFIALSMVTPTTDEALDKAGKLLRTAFSEAAA